MGHGSAEFNRRLLAGTLIVGAALGFLASVAGIVMDLRSQGTVEVDSVVYAAVFAFAFTVGLWLWRGEPRGRRWGIVLYALQIPLLTVGRFQYDFYNGVRIPLVHTLGDFSITLGFGASAELAWAQAPAANVLGIDLFAVSALIFLLTMHRLAPPTETAGVGA